MAEYQLYCFAQSGNSYKAALMLALLGARWKPIHVDFFQGETRSARYRQNVNEMGEVPVLESPGQRHHSVREALHSLRLAIEERGLKLGEYVTMIGRILGM